MGVVIGLILLALIAVAAVVVVLLYKRKVRHISADEQSNGVRERRENVGTLEATEFKSPRDPGARSFVCGSAVEAKHTFLKKRQSSARRRSKLLCTLPQALLLPFALFQILRVPAGMSYGRLHNAAEAHRTSRAV